METKTMMNEHSMEAMRGSSERMTVQRGLIEIKRLESDINDLIQHTRFCVSTAGGVTTYSGKPISEFEEWTKSRFDSIRDKIKRRNAIKDAIVESNSKTTVQIANKHITVAKAIEMKKSGIALQTDLITVLVNQYNQTQTEIETENQSQRMQERCDSFIVSMFGERTKSINPEEIEKARKTFMESNARKFICGFDISKEIDKLSDEIQAFSLNVDAALSEINGTTYITIDL